VKRIAHGKDNAKAFKVCSIVENQIADGLTATHEDVSTHRSRGNWTEDTSMSHRFWTIFILSWALGPFVLWVSLISTVRWYYQIQRSIKVLVDQIHPLA